VVAGKQRLMPFFNRSNNEDLILAIQSAGVSRGRNGFRKDTSGEPLARCNLIAAKTRRVRRRPARNIVQTRAELSLLKLCRVQPILCNTAPMAQTRFLPFGRSYFVVDTLYIGCEKLPYRDSFSLSMSGVL